MADSVRHLIEAWPAMAHVSAAAATGHQDYCPCEECGAARTRYVSEGDDAK